MKTKIFYLFALIVLIMLGWLSASLWFGSQSWGIGLGLPIAMWLLIVIYPKIDARAWIVAGLVILVMLVMPASVLEKIFRSDSPGSTMELSVLLTVSVALVVAALLLGSGLKFYIEGQKAGAVEDAGALARRKHIGRTVAVRLALSASLIAMLLYNVYCFMVWDTTGDSLGNIWLVVLPIPLVIFSGFLLSIVLPGKIKLIGLSYLFLIPVLFAVSAPAQIVDFHALTEERAAQVSQAIETYYAREGSYPRNLQQLIPWYFLSLSEPVIIYGQDWCYDGGDNFYQLGYVYREHWSDPNLIGRVYKTKGSVAALSGICQKEIAALEERYAAFRGHR